MNITLKNAYVMETGNHEEISVGGDWSNTLILRGDDAERFRQEYAEQLRTASDGKFKMELQINVEFE